MCVDAITRKKVLVIIVKSWLYRAIWNVRLVDLLTVLRLRLKFFTCGNLKKSSYTSSQNPTSFSRKKKKEKRKQLKSSLWYSQRKRESTQEYTWLINKIGDIDREVLTSVWHVREDAIVYEAFSGQEPQIADRRSELRNAVERLSISRGSHRSPVIEPIQVQRNDHRERAARQSDDPRARTPTDLNCKLISLLCSQPPSAYHLSSIRDAVAQHASRRP